MFTHVATTQTVLSLNEYFEIIYNAALQENIEDIKAALPFVSVDINFTKIGAPISQLAAKNKLSAVLFLRNHFKASERWIIYGFGLANNTDLIMQMLRKQNNNPLRYFELLKYACSGLAHGFHQENALALITLAKNDLQKKILYQLFLTGMAANNGMDQIVFADDDMPAIIYGYMLGGHTAIALRVLETITQPELQHNCICEVIRGSAETGGNPQELINMETIPPEDFEEFTIIAANAYARAGFGNEAQATAFQFENAIDIEVESVAMEFAESGNLDELRNLYEAAGEQQKFILESTIVRGLANGEHIGALEYIMGVNNTAYYSLLPKIIQSFMLQNNFEVCNSLLPLLPAEELNPTLNTIVNIIKFSPQTMNDALSTQILLQYSPGYRLPFATALVAQYPHVGFNPEKLAAKLAGRTNHIETIMQRESYFNAAWCENSHINRLPYSYNIALAASHENVTIWMLQKWRGTYVNQTMSYISDIPEDIQLGVLPYLTPTNDHIDLADIKKYFHRYTFFRRMPPENIGKRYHSSRRLAL
jgi:hypothetical protein